MKRENDSQPAGCTRPEAGEPGAPLYKELKGVLKMKRCLPMIFLGALQLLLCACEENLASKQILATPSITESGIQWGGVDTPKITANIDSIAIECIPIRKENEKPSFWKSKTDAREYEIAATAKISYEILNKNFYRNISLFRNVEANVIFEALAPSGVVIGEARGIAKIIENGNGTTVSAKITGLAPEEVRRIFKVQAKWDYGK